MLFSYLERKSCFIAKLKKKSSDELKNLIRRSGGFRTWQHFHLENLQRKYEMAKVNVAKKEFVSFNPPGSDKTTQFSISGFSWEETEGFGFSWRGLELF